jgi:hypothetical protein
MPVWPQLPESLSGWVFQGIFKAPMEAFSGTLSAG